MSEIKFNGWHDEKWVAEELEKRSKAMGISKQKFIKLMIRDWFDLKRKLVISE